ncbi:MAG: VanZ family protein [Planctomycetales bacterium]
MTTAKTTTGKLIDWIQRHPRRVRALLAGYWVLIFIGTHLPRIPKPLEQVSDKSLHFSAYAGLALLLLFDALSHRQFTILRHGVILVLCFVYSVADELLQIPVGRSCDVLDAVADMAGVSTILLISLGIHFLARKSPA